MEQIKQLTEFSGNTPYELFKSASNFLRKTPGSSLNIPNNRYVISTASSKKLQSAVMSGAFGQYPKSDDAPPFQFNRGICFNNLKDIKIHGNSSTIISDGFLQTLYMKQCRNVVIEDLVFDMSRRPYSCGTVVACSDRPGNVETQIQFDADSPININTPIVCFSFSDLGDGVSFPVSKFSIIDSFSATVNFDLNPGDILGYRFKAAHTGSLLPCIRIEECENIMLQNITILSAPGDGISTDSKNSLTIERYKASVNGSPFAI